ncbi:MAG: hypothetical protein WCS85_04895 [Candidatus Peribacteraceae bacterium]
MKPEGIDAAQGVAVRFSDLVLRTADALRTGKSPGEVTLNDVRSACDALMSQGPGWKPEGCNGETTPTLAQTYFEAWHGPVSNIRMSPVGTDMRKHGIPILIRADHSHDADLPTVGPEWRQTDSNPQPETAVAVASKQPAEHRKIEANDEARLFIWELHGTILRAIHAALERYRNRLQRGSGEQAARREIRRNGTTDVYTLAEYASTDVDQLLRETRNMLHVALTIAETLYSVGSQMIDEAFPLNTKQPWRVRRYLPRGIGDGESGAGV